MTDAPTAQRCFICGYNNPNGLEKHHLVPRRYGGTDLPENLVTLCASCHAAIEKLYDDRFYERLGLSGDGSDGPVNDMDIHGKSLDAEESLDRPFPPFTPHANQHNETGDWHCAYCHTAFESYQVSNLARHLRIMHGVENPYEDSQRERKLYDKPIQQPKEWKCPECGQTGTPMEESLYEHCLDTHGIDGEISSHSEPF